MATATTSKDIHGREAEHVKADQWFREEGRRLQKKRDSLTPLPNTRYGYSTKGAFLTIKRIKGETNVEEKVPLTPALYDMKALTQIATEMGKAKASAEEITARLLQDATVKWGVCVTQESEGRLGQRTTVNIAPTPDGYVSTSSIEHPILGTPIVFDSESGKYSFGSLTSKEEYLKWLPAIQSGWENHNMWCVDYPCEKVADMADQTTEMLARLNKQIENLHGVSIYTIAPRWLRYYSDGSMGTQKSAAYGVRSAELLGGGMRPLLYDGPAWVVGLRMGSRMIPGRVFVTPEGRFIASDWCQRETGKEGGIDLHTGEFTKHTLMSWCAGPGISRFGDDEIKKRHGSLRRATQITRLSGLAPEKSAARRKLMQMLVRVKTGKGLVAGKAVDDGATQLSSLRIAYVPGKYAGGLSQGEGDEYLEYNHVLVLIARFGRYVHRVMVPLDANGIIVPSLVDYYRYAGTVLQSHFIGTGDAFEITDKELAKEIAQTLREAF